MENEKVEFTKSELEDLAEFVCGRVDALNDILDNGKNLPDSTRKGILKDIKQLQSLDAKLINFYQKRGN